MLGNAIVEGNLFLTGGVLNGEDIKNGTIDSSKIKNLSLETQDFAHRSVTDLKIASGAVYSFHVLDNSIR